MYVCMYVYIYISSEQRDPNPNNNSFIPASVKKHYSGEEEPWDN